MTHTAPAAPTRGRLLPLALALLIAVLAALPRLGQIDRPVTPDEPLWFLRSVGFSRALLARDWPDTFQTGHPGVTTMWLGAIATGFEHAPLGRLDLLSPVRQREFAAARQALAIAGSLLLAVLVLLVARLLGAFVAALAGLLLALDPWLVAHNRVLHLDGLLSLFVAIATLACLVRWQGGGGRRYLLLGGVAAGLALLTKSAALAILPPVLLLPALARVARTGQRGGGALLADLLLLGLAAAVTMLALWPALWADPLGTALRVVQFGEETGGAAHELGSFFLGRKVDNPGPGFYPTVLAFRLSPLVVLGVLAWGLERAIRLPRARPALGPVATLGLCAALVVAAMTLAAKKQDRYVLPAVPLLAVVAAVGLGRVLRPASAPPGLRPLALGCVGLAQLFLCANERPYFLTYYSPLLGGAPVARGVIPVGWGEGLDPVAGFLNRQPGTRNVLAPPSVIGALAAQVRARTKSSTEPASGHWQVTYVNADQRGDRRRPEMTRLLLVVRMHGVEYARLYVEQ